MEQQINVIFPKDVYADVRIENTFRIWLCNHDHELEDDGDYSSTGIMIRVFDGNMWYTASTNDVEDIQMQLDGLAALATPNPQIFEHPVIQRLEVHQDSILQYQGEEDLRKVTREEWKELVDHYVEECVDSSIPELATWMVRASAEHRTRQFYSSKGASITWDEQYCDLTCVYVFNVDGKPMYGYKSYMSRFPEGLKGHEAEVIQERDRYLSFAKEALDIEPGEYTCVLSPLVTAMFTHESFGHKSEADFMLNDKTLQEEWILGKKVSNEKVSICDSGDMPNHGYVPYDDEGSKAKPTWLIRDGILTGRLHNAKSAATLGEELTGNCRAQNYCCEPVVRMTNTFMQAGDEKPDDLIKTVKDGIYVYGVTNGTGMSTFVMNPDICYRIKDGKICEPVKVHMITGNVFQTMFDIDGVGSDFEIFDSFLCGKMGQTVNVSAGGPSIRVRKLSLS